MWRARDVAKSSYRRLLENARPEVLLTASIADEVTAHLPVGRPPAITVSAGKGMAATLAATLAVAEPLGRAGYRATPNGVARTVQSSTSHCAA